MLFPDKTIDSLLSMLVSCGPMVSKDIHAKLLEDRYISLQQVYKVVRRLLHLQILEKKGQKVFLHPRRIVAMKKTATMLAETPAKNTHNDYLLHEGEVKTFHADSFKQLDSIWTSIVVSWIKMIDYSEAFYDYSLHAYHLLGALDTELAYIDSVKSDGREVYYLIGDDSDLDTYAQQLLIKKGISCYLWNNHPFGNNTYFFSMIGDYILEVFLPFALHHHVGNIFEQSYTLEEIKKISLDQMFYEKLPCTITIRRDKNYTTMLQSICNTFIQSHDKHDRHYNF